MLFDPIKSRQSGFDAEMLRFYLGTQYDPSRPMGNVAVSELGTVIKAWLVGLDKEIRPVIARSLEWIEKAIIDEEEFGADLNGYRTTLYWAKALAGWMENGWDYEGDWDNARRFEEARWRYEKRPWTTKEIAEGGLNDYMAFSYQGGEHDDGFEAGIDMYERWCGRKEISLSKVLKPRDFGYVLCLHRTARRDFDEDDLTKAGRRMLQANLQENWIGGGQYLRAAMWLKIVYWSRDDSLTPLQTILKAYDDMPRVVRPNFS